MEILYFSTSDAITKEEATGLLRHVDLVKLAEEHMATTGIHNPGSILTYNALQKACSIYGISADRMLKAVIFRDEDALAGQ